VIKKTMEEKELIEFAYNPFITSRKIERLFLLLLELQTTNCVNKPCLMHVNKTDLKVDCVHGHSVVFF